MTYRGSIGEWPAGPDRDQFAIDMVNWLRDHPEDPSDVELLDHDKLEKE